MTAALAFLAGVLAGTWLTRRTLIRHHQAVQDAAARLLRRARVRQCEAEARAARAIDTVTAMQTRMANTERFLAVLQGEQVPES